MNYRLLNEVLIEWNNPSKDDSDNVFLRSEDIKRSLDKCFIYKLDEKDRIKIFDNQWRDFEKYKNKVWINNQQVELKDNGCTVDYFEPREYRVYIENINKVTDMTCMFSKCKQLVSAFIPGSVTEISELAFQHCTRLASVAIPKSVTSIGDYAFYGCTSLTSMEIPNSVTSIGDYTFLYCTSLASITIPNSVTEIGIYAFSSCINLKTVYVKDINKFNQINFVDETADPRWYGAKVIELKK